ncbi:glycosyltransferase family 2 protein [Streptomyces qinzhouensis]|uniref:Glycosyltransferase family 2 protein n=1 Tax=Streptomyces qinzhouensis TaxID=2599401 RepID=A0A5B8J9F4_9ACTN|nr:glycosyltransferase family 2 protein [Streptomyces qinzhouensis]QDY77024.1 glycosyltransferase family 2 protein [Streptomyces qinzhouensis]
MSAPLPATSAAFRTAHPSTFPRHVVTAVLVSHDGARWLPETLAGLLAQRRPVQNVIAADTGSADESALLLTESLGADRVLNLARRTGFGTAVEEAARTAGVLTPDDLPYLRRPSGWDASTRTWHDEAYDMPELPYGEPVQWLWLLHDDSAPEPTALAELLKVVEADEHAVIVGPKLRGWYDRRQLLEVGVSIAYSGRRWTGLDRREPDQGQHDQVRAVLSVSTAGMLIRRDVFDALGGFDRRLPLMRDDLDLCWRAHRVGHRILIAPDAVLRHAEAATRQRRTVDCAGRSTASPHRVAKAGAVHTLLTNTHAAALPLVLLRIAVGTLVRTLAYLVGKAPRHAVDEVAGLLSVLLRPGRVVSGRTARRRARAAAAGSVVEAPELRPLFPPAGATVKAGFERVLGRFSRSRPDTAPGPAPEGDDAEPPEAGRFPRLRKLALRPAPALFTVLVLVTLVACRDLLTPGALAGGALLPAPGDVSGLLDRYADQWHPLGTGGTPTAPPYLGILAGLGTLLFGSTGLTVTVLLVCSVPLAGLTVYLAARPLITSRLLRAWGSLLYALLPATTGALASGRIGTSVLAILLPLAARAAVTAHGLDRTPAAGPRRGIRRRLGRHPSRPTAQGTETGPGTSGGHPADWRATWTYALLLTVLTAFTPVVWPLAVVLGGAALVARRDHLAAAGARFAAAVLTPMVLLAPWSLTLLTDPSALLREAGLDLGDGRGSALGLLVLAPGGPEAGGSVLLIGLVLAALAALIREGRRLAIRTAWAVALAGFALAALVNGSAWAGPATLVYGAGLIAAACLGAELGRTRVSARDFGWRQPVAVLIAALTALAPVQLAVAWAFGGADGPLERRDPVQVPAFVAEESGTSDRPRTLVLGGTSPGRVPYALLRGAGVRLGDAELARAAGGDPRLDRVVARLVAGSGADQAAELSGYAIRYVLVRDGAPPRMSRVLDTTPGLTRLSRVDGSALWGVDRQVARVTVMDGTADPLPVPSGPVDVRATLPAGGPDRILRLADRADANWRATLNGRQLPKRGVDGWAQGFELPAGGGSLVVTYQQSTAHTGWLRVRHGLVLVLVVLALPGRRGRSDDDLPDEPVLGAVPRQRADGALPAASYPLPEPPQVRAPHGATGQLPDRTPGFAPDPGPARDSGTAPASRPPHRAAGTGLGTPPGRDRRSPATGGDQAAGTAPRHPDNATRGESE